MKFKLFIPFIGMYWLFSKSSSWVFDTEDFNERMNRYVMTNGAAIYQAFWIIVLMAIVIDMLSKS